VSQEDKSKDMKQREYLDQLKKGVFSKLSDQELDNMA
jgi:hypothetical protein